MFRPQPATTESAITNCYCSLRFPNLSTLAVRLVLIDYVTLWSVMIIALYGMVGRRGTGVVGGGATATVCTPSGGRLVSRPTALLAKCYVLEVHSTCNVV